ncbi:MAG TPA: hypothetical protein VFA57_16980 [Pseudolabrys sp.]|nr:hypothetical protein [Pseudolabrys sp.]HZT27394.1 hypothetical protein [Pseudolabrys sp.]
MDQQTAWQVVRTSYRCSADLQVLMKFLKERCSSEDYKSFAKAIATVIDTMNAQLVDRAVAIHPDIGRRIESDIEKFGHLT